MATTEQRIYEGNRAREILENEVFQQVFADIEQELMDAWKKSPQRDETGRESIFRYVITLQKIKSALVNTFESGRLSSIDLEYKKSMIERTKDFVSNVLP